MVGQLDCLRIFTKRKILGIALWLCAIVTFALPYPRPSLRTTGEAIALALVLHNTGRLDTIYILTDVTFQF